MESGLVFSAGSMLVPSLPMGRYLPPVAEGMISGWLQRTLSPGDWVLDPFGASPQLALEGARAGLRVLVASNNPILSFLLDTLAQAPSRAEFLAALAELSSSRRGDERLESHLRRLYETECPTCHQIVQPEAYLWRKGETQPFARLLHCPHCGEEGEHLVTAADVERLSRAGNPHLHQARALERIALPGEALREQAQDLMSFYLPRALYFLTTLINRIEGLAVTAQRRQWLTALALSVCDQGNSLWAYPEARSRPRQLTVPPVFRENNLWLALEEAAQDWLWPGSSVPMTRWPELPPAGGGICLYPGRLKELLPLPRTLTLQAVTAVIPRPNQAFWSLSAMWSGWLWGREAVTPLRAAVERQRYDWHWHANALVGVFSLLAPLMRENEIPFWCVLPELAPGFLSATQVAGEAAGLNLQGMALPQEEDIGQMVWTARQQARPRQPQHPCETVIENAVQGHLRQIGQPSTYLALHAAGLKALAESSLLAGDRSTIQSEQLTQLQNHFMLAFKSSVITHIGSEPSANLESGWWWLSHDSAAMDLALSDRVEMEVVRWLARHPGQGFAAIAAAIDEKFRGLHTPARGLIRECLESYALLSGDPPGWQLRQSELPAVRRADLAAIRRGLVRLGAQLGYQSEGDMPLNWVKDMRSQYLLFPMASGMIARYIFKEQQQSPRRCLLVVPGSRVNLILYKLRHNPALAEALASGWRLVKFRQLRQMLSQSNLTAAAFESLVEGDPPRWEEATQLQIL